MVSLQKSLYGDQVMTDLSGGLAQELNGAGRDEKKDVSELLVPRQGDPGGWEPLSPVYECCQEDGSDGTAGQVEVVDQGVGVS